MQFKVIGCGEAFESELGNTSFLLSDETPLLLIDCGYQVPERLYHIPNLIKDLKGIYLTHFHADHAMGLAPLLVKMYVEQRTNPLTLFGPSGLEPYYKKVMDLAYSGVRVKLPFQIALKTLKKQDRVSWEKLELHTAQSEHAVTNYSVRIDLPSGNTIGVSGDGQMTPETQDLFWQATHLYHECYFLDEAQRGHECFDNLIKYKQKSELKKLFLTHTSQTLRKDIFTRYQALEPKDVYISRPGDEEFV